MPGKVKLLLSSMVVAGFAAQASAAVPLGSVELAAQFSGPVEREQAVRIAYHDMGHARAVEQASGVGVFKRGELRIDRGLNCFLAGSGDLICFSAEYKNKSLPSQDVTQEEKAAPTNSEN